MHGARASGAQQVFEAADPSLPHPSLSCKFLWMYPRLQINAGWGPLSRPSPSRCSCGFYCHKEAPKVELQSALVVESPNPLDATVWYQSLVYVVRRGWERAEHSPVLQQVSHTWLVQERWGDHAPETGVTTGSSMEETQGRPKASYASNSQWARCSPPTPETLWGAQAAPLPLAPPWHWSTARGVVPGRLPYCRCTVCLTVMLRQVQNQGQTLHTVVTAE